MRWWQIQRGAALAAPLLRHAQGLAVAGLLLIQLVMSVSTLWVDWAMAAREAAVAAEVAQLERDRERLSIAVMQAADPAFLAVRARDVLQYAQPGEHLVIVAHSAQEREAPALPWWLYE